MNMNSMMSGSVEKLMGRMFRRVDTVVWDLMTGKLGIRTSDGEIATIEGEGDDASISINPFEDFGIAIPAFAQATPLASVKVGDLIAAGSGSGSVRGWIIEIKEKDGGKKTFRVISASGNISTWNPPKVEMFGFDSGVLVVRSLMNMLPGGESGLSGLQSNLLPMIMMSGGDLDLEKVMPMILMGSMNNSGGGMGNMMQMMLMMKMFGGDSMPFGNSSSRRRQADSSFR